VPRVSGKRVGIAYFRPVTVNPKDVVPEQLVEQIEAYVRSTADAIIEDMRIYPPELPNQRYVRTYNLRDSWNKVERKTSTGISIGITSEAAGYAEQSSKPGRILKTAKPVVKIKTNRKFKDTTETRENVTSGGGSGTYIYYTARVVGDTKGEGQAPIHQGRWQLFADVVATHREDYKGVLKEIRKRWGR
jgi:hypothetical protein